MIGGNSGDGVAGFRLWVLAALVPALVCGPAAMGLVGDAAAAPRSRQAAACAVVRDGALEALEAERIAITTALDTDAALMDSAEFELEKTRDSIMTDMDRERRAIQDRYRRCVAGEVPPK